MQSCSHELRTPVADCVYVKYIRKKIPSIMLRMTIALGYPIDVKLAGFRSQLEVSLVSSHTDETVCLRMTIYIYIYIYESK